MNVCEACGKPLHKSGFETEGDDTDWIWSCTTLNCPKKGIQIKEVKT